MSDNSEALLATFLRTDANEVRLRLRTFRGTQYLDLRTFFQPKGMEERVPTKRGIQVPLEILPELLTGLERAQEYVRLAASQVPGG